MLADLDRIKEIADQIDQRIRTTMISETVKLESKQPNGPRYVSMVLSLTMIEERWYVTDVEFKTEDRAFDKQQKFLEDNRKAIGVPSPASR